jgi:predicted metalloprotease with PDZ domain
MKRIAWWMVAVCVVALASPSFAGEGGKCTRATQACLNHWAKSKDVPWAGLQYDAAENGTLTVKSLSPGSPAATAGIQVGDVIVAMNGTKITDKEAIRKAKLEIKPGQTVQYTISRAGAEQQLPVTMATMPPEIYAAAVGSHMLENHVPMALAEASTEGSTVKVMKAEKK